MRINKFHSWIWSSCCRSRSAPRPSKCLQVNVGWSCCWTVYVKKEIRADLCCVWWKNKAVRLSCWYRQNSLIVTEVPKEREHSNTTWPSSYITSDLYNYFQMKLLSINVSSPLLGISCLSACVTIKWRGMMQELMNIPLAFPTQYLTHKQVYILEHWHSVWVAPCLESWKLLVPAWNWALFCYTRLLENTKETGFDVKVKKSACVWFQH